MKFLINIIESELGWGQKIDERKHFDSYEEAVRFRDAYNAENNLPYVPAWYMYAEGPFEVR